MAMNNFVSYQRFTSQPPNIAEHGATVEELVSARGTPDPDPVHSPMADQGVAAARLALSPSGSDRLRLGNPAQPDVNPYEGPKRTLNLSRGAVLKLKGQVLADLDQVIREGSVATEEVRSWMSNSMQRVAALRELAEHLNSLAELAQAHSLGASKG